ncbi:family 78 glycoside hydrolase catalytic domain [Mangrovimonas sp. ST2L15]|uniref:alpha-L-rhamnosidase-related protein n=1 Tax=Mangrovimonas sp. ST2L15 TaxID=1645916 RepID=UPI0006B659F9|nr:family 78 glycoside hydrolase catalytic domain [Mangrovimonas sp. ST2L15]
MKHSFSNFKWFLILSILLSNFLGFSQDYYGPDERRKWLDIAENNIPSLKETIKHPIDLVKTIKDTNAFQVYKTESIGGLDDFYKTSLKTQSGIILDFGEHITGQFTFSLNTLFGVTDAPVRLKFTFGEVPSEVSVPFDPYPGGLSRAWLQDEIVTVMSIPSTITLERRLSFRYVKVEVLGSSPYFDFSLTKASVKATTSATSEITDLSATSSELIKKIDQVGLNTLSECMQTVFEDGPKRDRRLWIGDLYLQALANMYSYENHMLTKRCLYLIAALAQEDGFLYSNVFEYPSPHAQEGSPFLFDYAILYNVILRDYLDATGDTETANDLWPVAKRQMDHITTYLGEDGVFNADKAVKNKWWLFVDWNDQLDRQTALQGIMIYSMKGTLDLAEKLNKKSEVKQLPKWIESMSSGALKHLYDKDLGLFISGKDRQVSYASQSWMILADVVKPKKARNILHNLQDYKNAIKPGGPYLYHYYVQALIDSDLKEDARELIENYWGGMVKKGADTFWEVYDPNNEELSPYQFYPVNSYCHAWSCTPVYFIRKYPEIFQN